MWSPLARHCGCVVVSWHPTHSSARPPESSGPLPSLTWLFGSDGGNVGGIASQRNHTEPSSCLSTTGATTYSRGQGQRKPQTQLSWGQAQVRAHQSSSLSTLCSRWAFPRVSTLLDDAGATSSASLALRKITTSTQWSGPAGVCGVGHGPGLSRSHHHNHTTPDSELSSPTRLHCTRVCTQLVAVPCRRRTTRQRHPDTAGCAVGPSTRRCVARSSSSVTWQGARPA